MKVWHDIKEHVAAAVARAARAAVREELQEQRAIDERRRDLDPHRGKLPAGVFLIPPAPAPRSVDDDDEWPSSPTVLGKTVLVGLGGGEVDVELNTFRPIARGGLLLAWGPVNLRRVRAGVWNAVEGGAMFAVLPELPAGYIVAAELEVWRR